MFKHNDRGFVVTNLPPPDRRIFCLWQTLMKEEYLLHYMIKELKLNQRIPGHQVQGDVPRNTVVNHEGFYICRVSLE